MNRDKPSIIENKLQYESSDECYIYSTVKDYFFIASLAVGILGVLGLTHLQELYYRVKGDLTGDLRDRYNSDFLNRD